MVFDLEVNEFFIAHGPEQFLPEQFYTEKPSGDRRETNLMHQACLYSSMDVSQGYGNLWNTEVTQVLSHTPKTQIFTNSYLITSLWEFSFLIEPIFASTDLNILFASSVKDREIYFKPWIGKLLKRAR